MKTYSTKLSDIERQWHLFDASGETLGKLAVEVARLLKGKHKAIYAPHLDTGDFVVVINAAKIRVTGNKLDQKTYYRHSGYPGGFRSVTLRRMLQSHPTRVVEHAVRGMLPRNRLGRAMIKKLMVYADEAHPHQAQLGRTVKQPKAKREEGVR